MWGGGRNFRHGYSEMIVVCYCSVPLHSGCFLLVFVIFNDLVLYNNAGYWSINTALPLQTIQHWPKEKMLEVLFL